MELQRGEIYFITFPYTLDERYPNGKLSPEKMDEIDEALFFGLCFGLQNEVNNEPADDE